METKVIVVGASISACMSAAYMKIKNPEWNVIMIGKSDQTHPIVGESLTEYSTYFLHEIGLGRYLEDNHYHKYGLSFYFKEDIENPECRRYAVHEANAIPPMPANLINRFDFDKIILKRCIEVGVKFIEGKAQDLKVIDQNKYEVAYKTDEGFTGTFTCDALVDASGRSRWLSRRLGLKKKDVMHQRNCFWFWVADFDRSLLENIEAVKEKQHAFDSYYVTHHFMSKGAWNWVIPIISNEYKDFVSIGMTWRPDLVDSPVTNMEEYLIHMKKEHPVLAEMVESGTIEKAHVYSNYMYDTEQIYSRDGWFLLSDAGCTVDPLYSTGIVMTAIQSTQINEMIRMKVKNQLNQDYVDAMQGSLTTVRGALQGEIGDLYSTIADPYQSQWRIHFSSAWYFYSLLPLWLCKFMINKDGANWVKNFIMSRRASYMNLLALLPKASSKLGKVKAERLRNLYDISVNWSLWGPQEKKLEKYVSRMYYLFAQFRYQIFKDSGWADPINQVAYITKDLCTAFYYRFIFKFKKLIDPADSMKNFELIEELPMVKDEYVIELEERLVSNM